MQYNIRLHSLICCVISHYADILKIHHRLFEVVWDKKILTIGKILGDLLIYVGQLQNKLYASSSS